MAYNSETFWIFYPWAVYCEGPAAFIRCKKEEEEGEEGEKGEEKEEQKHLFVGKSYELSRTVFTSEIGQYIFWQEF